MQFATYDTNKDFSGDVIRNTFSVEAGVTYDFNFILTQANSWALISPAKLALTIDGVPVSQYYTVSQTPQKVEGQWTATTTGTVTLAINNLVSTGYGNDFWVDDIAIARHTAAGPVDTITTAFIGEICEAVVEITDHQPLSVSLDMVLTQGESALFHDSSSTQMMITGDAGDVVNLSDMLPDGSDVGDWNVAGDITVGGVTYQVYQHSGLDADLLVQNNMKVNLDNH